MTPMRAREKLSVWLPIPIVALLFAMVVIALAMIGYIDDAERVVANTVIRLCIESDGGVVKAEGDKVYVQAYSPSALVQITVDVIAPARVSTSRYVLRVADKTFVSANALSAVLPVEGNLTVSVSALAVIETSGGYSIATSEKTIEIAVVPLNTPAVLFGDTDTVVFDVRPEFTVPRFVELSLKFTSALREFTLWVTIATASMMAAFIVKRILVE